MKPTIFKILLVISAIRLIPHICIILLDKQNSSLFADDISPWTEMYLDREDKDRLVRSFVKLMTRFPEFRNLFYYRIGGVRARLLSWLCPPMSTLYILTPKIGPGLFIQHGFATIISAKEIGANCSISQQVTIGFSNKTDRPTIQDNVKIYAGAKVIGAVNVGSNSTVGANAVVVKDVPQDTTVVGIPARIVRRNGQRVDELL
jgi:serine O-acetyltransferase